MKTQNYNILDITKFLMALLVVCIHIEIIPSMPEVSHLFTNAIGRMGVPFFFICSGFLYFRKENALEVDALIKTLKRILMLSVGWTIIYGLVMLFTEYIHTEESPFYRFLLFLFRHIFLNPFGHLWFLPALMIGLLITWLVFKLKIEKIGVILAIILFALGVLGDSYYHWAIKHSPLDILFSKYYSFFTTTRNGVFIGFPFIFLSSLSTKYMHRGSWNKINLPLSVLFFAILLFEYYLVSDNGWAKDYNMYFSLLPFSILFFKTLIDIRVNISKKVSLFFREYSLGLYLIHPFWLFTSITSNYIYAVLASLTLIFIIKKLKIPILDNLLK